MIKVIDKYSKKQQILSPNFISVKFDKSPISEGIFPAISLDSNMGMAQKN